MNINWIFWAQAVAAMMIAWKLYRSENNDMAKKEIPPMSPETRRHLYNEDGSCKFTLKSEFENHRINCETRICKKIDGLKHEIGEMRKEKMLEQQEITNQLTRIAEFIGAAREFMESHR